MKSFDEWRNKQRNEVNSYTERDAYEAGQQSKQAEVDKLNQRIKELELINFDSELHFDAAKEKIDVLQKRIDKALNAVWNDKCSHIVIDILKGNTNEH